MGNRATVIFWNGETKPAKRSISAAVYLHWNGGPESIYSFLEELDRRGVRADQDYECARFVQVVGEFFTWSTTRDLSDPIYRDSAYGLSLGVVNGPLSDEVKHLDKVYTDHGDNGFYLVNRSLTMGAPGYMRRFTEQAVFTNTGEPCGERFWDLERSEYEFRLIEWTPEQVIEEFGEAMQSNYIPDIREFFLDLEQRAPAPEKALA